MQLHVQLHMERLDFEWFVHRLSSMDVIPASVLSAEHYSILRSPQELSVVCEANDDLAGCPREGPFAVLRVVGPLDFSLTGVVSRISAALADASIPIFVVSSYDTDYVLVPSVDCQSAMHVLAEADIEVC